MRSFTLAFATALLIPGAMSCAGVGVPNHTFESLSGPIEAIYRQSGAAGVTDNSMEACPGREITTDITEISLERTACYGLCRMYTVILRADGTATYTGRGNVEHLGEHSGVFTPARFQRLAALAQEIGFMKSLAASYSCNVSDNPTAYVSVVAAGTRKTIRHYAPDNGGPILLWWFEQVIDEVADDIDWQ